jgi:hypothetical protein
MPTLGYYARGPRDNMPVAKLIGDAPELLEKTAHVRKAKEKMMQFHARVGLGAAQIRMMSKDEISHFVETVSKNDEGFIRAQDMEPRVLPSRIVLDI